MAQGSRTPRWQVALSYAFLLLVVMGGLSMVTGDTSFMPLVGVLIGVSLLVAAVGWVTERRS